MVSFLGLYPFFHEFAADRIGKRQIAVVGRGGRLILGQEISQVAVEIFTQGFAVHRFLCARPNEEELGVRFTLMTLITTKRLFHQPIRT